MPTYREILAQARAEIDEVTSIDVHDHVITGESPFLLDVPGRHAGVFHGDDFIALVDDGHPRRRLVRIPVATAADTTDDLSTPLGQSAASFAARRQSRANSRPQAPPARVRAPR